VSSRPRLGLALGGGFARGLAHIGVLKALADDKIPVDLVAGTSMGSIIGACYCSGMSIAELEQVGRTSRFGNCARWAPSRYGFCSNDRITHFCVNVLKMTTFEELKVPLAITATDFQTGEAKIFAQGGLAGPMRASCAYPGMFPPVEVNGRRYVDGMFAYAVPTTPLREMGAERVIAVDLGAHWMQQRDPRNMFEVIGRCFSIAEARVCAQWRRDADVVLSLDVSVFEYDCFDRAAELIALGESSMRAILPQVRTLPNLPTRCVESLPADVTPVSAPLVVTAAPDASQAA
jgi:NTE family protein